MATESLIIDASVAINASLVDDGFRVFEGRRLTAPALLLSETAAGLRQLEWRGEVSADEAQLGLDRVLKLDVELFGPAVVVRDASFLSRRLGWAKTYDAEYIALARQLESPLVTLDARLRRTAAQFVTVLGPTEINGPTLPLVDSKRGDLAERAEEELTGFGEG